MALTTNDLIYQINQARSGTASEPPKKEPDPILKQFNAVDTWLSNAIDNGIADDNPFHAAYAIGRMKVEWEKLCEMLKVDLD